MSVEVQVSFGEHAATLPVDATDTVFRQNSSGKYQVSYQQVEREDKKGIILADRKRVIKTDMYFSAAGTEEARCVTKQDWEIEKPGIDPMAVPEKPRIVIPGRR